MNEAKDAEKPDSEQTPCATICYAVLAFGEYRNNAELIEAAGRLGYIGDAVLDLSYGHGEFWTKLSPSRLVTNDVNPRKGEHHFDVRCVPPTEWKGAFDTVVWDGPYRLNGRSDRGVFDEKFGVDEPMRLQDRLNLVLHGVVFASQCVKRGGTVLVKCQDQVAGGRKQQQRRMVQDVGELFGLTWKDELHLKCGVRKQRTQKHTRSNFSTLVVFTA